MKTAWINILIILLIASLTTALGIQYMSIPLKRQHNNTNSNSAYLVPVIFNNASINIQLNLQNNKGMLQSMSKSIKGDKNTDNGKMMAQLQYKNHRFVDWRLPEQWQIIYNTYYYFKNMFVKTTWIVLNRSQNTFNFSLEGIKELQNLKAIKQCNPLVVSLSLDDQNEGQLMVGDFPVDKLLKDTQFYQTTIKGNDKWIMEVSQIVLEYKDQILFKQTHDYTMNMNINLNSKTIISQKMASFITFKFKKCQFQYLNQVKSQQHQKASQLKDEKQLNRHLICNSEEQFLSLTKSVEFKFKLPNNTVPIIIKMEDLAYKLGQNLFLINMDYGDEIQLGQNVLKSYIVGIDYKQMKLIYGLKDSINLFPLKKLSLILLWCNISIFVVSLVIIIVVEIQSRTKKQKQRHSEMYESSNGQLGMSKSNQYQLAEINDQQIQKQG